VPTLGLGGGEGSRYKLSGPRSGSDPDCVAYNFASLGIIIICRAYKLSLSHQDQVTSTSSDLV